MLDAFPGLLLDEAFGICGTCPNNVGFQFPRTNEMAKHIFLTGNNWDAISEYNTLATFSCRHKVTKRAICAIPCNGITEMCEYDVDEQCQGIGLPIPAIVISTSFVFALCFLSAAFLMRHFRITKKKSQREVLEMDYLSQSNEKDMLIFKCKLYVHIESLEFKSAIKVAEKYFREYPHERCDVDKDLHLMKSLGTNELTALFYDCIDRSLMIRYGLYFQLCMPSVLLKAYEGRKFRNIYAITLCVVSLSIRYSDLPKDIFFLYVIWLHLGNYKNGSFPIVIFWILFSSIITSEILHFITIIMYRSRYMGRTAMALLATPLMPAFFMFENLHLYFKLDKLRRQCCTKKQMLIEEIHKLETKSYKLKLVTAKMQCTENVVENLTQFTILAMVISLSHTATRAVENIDRIFVKTNESLGYILAAMSFISLIGGQIRFLKANKNGCLGLKGSLFVIPYFVLGTCSRYCTDPFVQEINGVAFKF